MAVQSNLRRWTVAAAILVVLTILGGATATSHASAAPDRDFANATVNPASASFWSQRPPITTAIVRAGAASDASADPKMAFLSGSGLTGDNTRWATTSLPLFGPAGPRPSDIYQGMLGDCYFVSAVSAEATRGASYITQIIRKRSDGMIVAKIGGRSIVMSPNLPVYSTHSGPWGDSYGRTIYSAASPTVGTWVAYLEKAYAIYRGSYSAIAYGGPMVDATNALESRTSPGTAQSVTGDLGSFLNWRLDNGYAITLSSPCTASDPAIKKYGLATCHAYTVTKVAIVDGSWRITVRNPWGYSNPAPAAMSTTQLRDAFDWIATYQGWTSI